MREPIICGLEYSKSTLEKLKKFGYLTKMGVVYDEELAGPNGMSFCLLREPHTTDEMLINAVRELRSNRDVVGKIKVTQVIEHE